MSVLSLSLLGSFRAEINGSSLQKFRTNKVQALLIYLTVENKENISRDALMGLLWPDLARESAQVNLRQTVFQLRKLLPELAEKGSGEVVPFVLSKRQTVGVHTKADYTVDTAVFAHLLAETQRHPHPDLATCPACRDRLEQAVLLYRGDFLSDFYLADSNIFEEWSMIKRESLRQQVLDALETVTNIHLHQGSYHEAQGFAQRQIEIDNLRENACRQLMESLARDGQRNAAVAQYEACRLRLDEELGMAPTDRTTRLYTQIKAGELGLTLAQPNQIRGYELLEEIGVGSFGAVHRAVQPAVGREVAVKIILPRYANQPDFIRRFEAEAHMVARLEHPHIVPLYDYWREPDGAYLVMRLLRGGNLEKMLQEGPVDLNTAVTFINQIASALDAAHRQGVIHRDLKPANILLDEEGNTYLADFGIAKDLADEQNLTATGNIVGSPAYISPEQVLSEQITPMTDIYSFGIILYTLLTGQAPFAGVSLATLIHKHLNEPLPLIHERNTAVPSQIDDVIQRATCKNPQQRYSNALALAYAFREAINQAGIGSLPSPLTGMTGVDITVKADTLLADLLNPYQGLRPFQETDSAHFFGRDLLIQQLLSRLDSNDRPIGSLPTRFLAVVGPSGSGKSSVVKAGLIPALRQGAIANSENWFIVEMTPGSHPLEELEAALLHVAVNPPPSLIEPLQKDERGLIRTVKRILPHDQENHRPSELLLLIDQFEELFTLVEDKAVRNHFLNSLVAAVSDPRSRLRIIITLRADFYDRPLQHPGLGELLRRYTELILPLNAIELEQAVSNPAQHVGVTPEPELVVAITADVNEQPGALPLLQYALTELFERRDGRTMTQSAYEKIGGVSGALSRRAEEIYQSLDQNGQEATRQLFFRLVTLGEGIEDTRRRVLRSELMALDAELSNLQSSISQVVDLYGRYRLLSFDRDPITRGAMIEVAHEALLREWDRLRDWLDEGRDDVRWQRRLAVAATEWDQAGRDDGFLLRGSRLEQFIGWSVGAKIALTQDEQGYLETSAAAREKRQTAEEARRQRELETARQLATTEKARAEEQSQAAQRLRRRAVYLAGALAVAVLLAITAGLFGQQSRQNADMAATSQAEAVANARLAVTRETEAIDSANLAATSEAEALANAELAVASEAEAINSAELAAESASAEATAAAEAQTQQAIAETNAREAQEAYSQSLAAHAQNALETGDTAAGLALALAANDMEQPPSLSQRMLRQAAYAPGPRRQYQVAELFPDAEGRIYSLAMSPITEEALIGFEDGSLVLWDAATETSIHELEGHAGIVRAVAFSPDGKRALSGSSDHMIILWDLETGQEIRRFEGHDGWVRTVAFSPDGKTAVSGGFISDTVSSVVNPGQLILWDLASGQEIRRFEGHPSGVVAADFTPDGRAILASSGFFTNVANEYSLMLWDVESGEKIRDFEITGQSDNFSLAISSDGRTALTGTSADTVILWDLDTGKQIRTLEGHTGQMVTSVAYTPDGRRALSGDANGLLILSDLDGGDAVMRTGIQLPRMGGWHAEDAPVLNLVISPEGRRALSSAGDGTLVLWELVHAGEIRRFEGHQSPEILSVAFTPDGKRVLTGEWGDAFGFFYGDSNSLRLWDVETGEELRSFEGHTAGVIMIAVSADGRQALTGSQDGTIRLWDLETGEEIRQILAHAGGVFSVALSPDGRLALSGSMADDLADSGITLWDLESGRIIHRLEDHNHYTTLLFNLDGQTAYSSNADEALEFGQYDLETGQLIHSYSTPLCCTGFAVHPNGRSVFLAHNSGGPVIEWDLEADREIRAFGQHLGTRTRVEVSPDGRLLLISATNFEGGALSLWDLETSQEIRRFSGGGFCCFDIDMSPDGRMAITSGGDGTAILWDLSLPTSMDEVRQWIADNRYARPLSCAEREQYGIKPLCEG